MKKKKFTTVEAMVEARDEFVKDRGLLGDQNHILKMVDYSSCTVKEHSDAQGNCAKQCKDGTEVWYINALYEWPRTDLSKVLKAFMADKNNRMPHELLMNIGISMIHALATLEDNNLYFGDLRPMYIGKSEKNDHDWVLLDRLKDNQGYPEIHKQQLGITKSSIASRSGAEAIPTLQKTKDGKEIELFMAPEVLTSLNPDKPQTSAQEYYNTFRDNMEFQYTVKSDVFSLGMCILNAGSLSTIEPCYAPMYYRFDEAMLQGKFNMFANQYHAHHVLVDFVKRCLTVNLYNRPSANELKSYLLQQRQEIEDPHLSRYSFGNNFAMIHCKHPEPEGTKSQFLRDSTYRSQGSLFSANK